MHVWYGVSCLLWLARSPAAEVVFPGEHWETRTPEQAGLAVEKLEEFRDMVGGRGCVVRAGYSWQSGCCPDRRGHLEPP